MKSLIILFSYHHNNTEKIAEAIARVLEAQIKRPWEVDHEEVQRFDLVGFGSGIYDERHQKSLLDLADKLPRISEGRAFIFSTSGISSGYKAAEDHRDLRDRLVGKGYVIVDEFQCVDFNTNSFLKFFGGINKGRPNAKDLKDAEEFARNLIRVIQ